MSMQAAGARTVRSGVPAGVRQIRLGSGLVLMTYVGLHLSNHAMGNISLAWMERVLLLQKFIWQGVIGTTALYSALSVHFVLGLWALYERRRVHWTAEELLQLGLGLAIPPLIANHLAVTRVAFTALGLNKGYAQELYSFWIASPFLGRAQLVLLVVAWTHGCLGMWFWLRMQRWFTPIRSVLLVAAVLLPVLALLGYFQAGRAVVELAKDPAWRAIATPPTLVGTPAQNAWLASLRNGFFLFDGIAVGLVLLARLLRSLRERRSGRFRVLYPGGQRPVVPIGLSVLEVSLISGIPHATACGGRGRCTLCRVRVMGEGLPLPAEAERRVLARLGVAPDQVRLACQLRPRRDLSVIPLVPPEAQRAFLHRRQAGLESQERFLVHMFVDMRDSTRFAATRMPHDTVFLLGRFIGAVSAAVLEAGGVPNQFLGDGILAIFGLTAPPRTACLQSLAALGGVARNIRVLGTLLEQELDTPLRFGIGMQCGRTIIGEIGFRNHVTVTGLGDPPNVASRLQGLSRELGCEAVVAEDIFSMAGLSGAALPPHQAQLRGRADAVPARLFFAIERDLALLHGEAPAPA
jgi:adenylate cyclase